MTNEEKSEVANLARGYLFSIWTPVEGMTPASRAAKATKALDYSFGDLMANVQRALKENDTPGLQQFNEAMSEGDILPVTVVSPTVEDILPSRVPPRPASTNPLPRKEDDSWVRLFTGIVIAIIILASALGVLISMLD